MRTADFNYSLPNELITRHRCQRRRARRHPSREPESALCPKADV